MRTNLFILGIWAAAALATASCAKEKEADGYVTEADGGIRFEIVANSADTKTVNDGLSTRWAEGDAVNVFHAVAGSKDYINDGEFTLNDAENGKFTGTLASALDLSQSYDWYVYYPYNPEITSPENTSGGYSTVAAFTQSQDGDKGMAMAHLAGLPLAGKSTTEAGGANPVVSMKNLAAVIKVEVTNNSGAYIPVTRVTFISPVNIAGDYSVNFEDPANPVYTDKNEGVGKYVTLTTSVPTNIGETSTFFLAVKPFEASASSTMKLEVNGYVKTLSLDTPKTFSAGTVYNYTFNYDYVAPGKKRRVVCWGDSYTYSAYDVSYCNHLQELLGDEWEVVQAAVPGFKTFEIAASQGSIPVVTWSAFTIPANVQTITIDPVLKTHDVFGNPGLFNIRVFCRPLEIVNPCRLIGVNGEEVLCDVYSNYRKESNNDTTYYASLKRRTPGAPVRIAEHTLIEPYAAREYRDADLSIIYMGTNGTFGSNSQNVLNVGGFRNLAVQHREMINYTYHPDSYIVLGRHNAPDWDARGYSDVMEDEFSNRYINIRRSVVENGTTRAEKEENLKQWFLYSGAYTDESEIPTSEISRGLSGYWPYSFYADADANDSHPNEYAARIFAKLIYDRMVELGYIN